MKFAIGDVVRYDLSESHGGGPDQATVIGYTFPDVCVVADGKAIGMPINEAHCTRIGDDPKGIEYRQRYEDKFGPMLPI